VSGTWMENRVPSRREVTSGLEPLNFG
jgi:hypothetical protein